MYIFFFSLIFCPNFRKKIIMYTQPVAVHQRCRKPHNCKMANEQIYQKVADVGCKGV